MSWSNDYRSERAFWVALRTRATQQSRTDHTHSSQELIRQFVIQRFIARLFTDTDSTPWVVAGGTGMLIRMPGARATRDLDLTTLTPDLGEPHAVQQALSTATGAHDADPFIYTVDTGKPFTGAVRGTKLRITATISTDRAATFGLDVAADTILVSDIEHQQMQPAVPGMRGLPTLPSVPLFPLASQIADKVVGVMYRDDKNRSANRYRDLVDLALYAQSVDVSAAALRSALAARAATRDQPPPDRIEIPPGWEAGYARTAAPTSLPVPLRDAATAADVVNAWLQPVLSGSIAAEHIWDHSASAWRPPDHAPHRPGEVWVRPHTRDGRDIADYYRRAPRRP